MNPETLEAIKQSVRFFYDMQKLRIQSSNRTTTNTVILDTKHGGHLDDQGDRLSEMERKEMTNIRRLLKTHPLYTQWLKEQKGCGPTLSGVIISEIDITKAPTVSALWSYCGLAVDSKTGKAVRMKRGEKAGYNPWLKAKLVKVLGDCLIRANSPWRKFYDDYKLRKQNTLVDQCMLCKGKGVFKSKKETSEEEKTKTEPKEKKCTNCKGTGGPAPWGQSDAHRHQAAIRYMVKMFLQEMWTVWRTIEELPVTDPYAVAVLGRTHGDHGGMGVVAPAPPPSPALH